MTLTPGQVLNNRYRIVSLLGKGGMGDVYRAWDLNLKVSCAVKENLDISQFTQRQFEHEATILARLRHPSLPRVTDHFFITGQGQYLVMDFVGGQNLEEMRTQAGGRLPEAQVLDWMIQVLDALGYLHSQPQPVIHRDIKPANIKIAPPDANHPQGCAVLVDFGIAKTYDLHKDTTVGARAVTPGYSPYEQYGQTTAATDERSDIYALGATLYTLLTGQEPVESILRVVRDPLVPPRQLNPAISPAIEYVILRALKMDPDRRFQSSAEFKAGIHGTVSMFDDQPTTLVAPQPPTLPQVWEGVIDGVAVQHPKPGTTRWKWLGVGTGVLAGLILVAVLAVLAYQQIISGHLTQTSQARASQTAAALAAMPTSTPSPLPPSITPSSMPIPLTATFTRSPRPPSRTPTRTPRPTPSFTLAEPMFCRAGPAEEYEAHTTLYTGDTVPVLARWYANNWLLVGISNPVTRTKCCWVGGLGDLNVERNTIRTIDFLPDREVCDLTP